MGRADTAETRCLAVRLYHGTSTTGNTALFYKFQPTTTVDWAASPPSKNGSAANSKAVYVRKVGGCLSSPAKNGFSRELLARAASAQHIDRARAPWVTRRGEYGAPRAGR